MNHQYSVRLNESERLFERAFTFALRAQMKPVTDFYSDNGYLPQPEDLIKPGSLKMPYIQMFIDAGMREAGIEYEFQRISTRDRAKAIGWDILRAGVQSLLAKYAEAHYLTIQSSITSTTVKILSSLISGGKEDGLSDSEINKELKDYSRKRLKSRARSIAITEAGYITNAARFISASNYFLQQGLRGYKQYLTREDERVRPAHEKLNNRVLPIDSDFHFDDKGVIEFAPYPCSDVLSLAQKVGCRCTVIYFSEDALDDYQ